MSKSITACKLVEEIKRNSSRWIKTKHIHYSHFAWQTGYGAFSVSPSVCQRTIEYINNQALHHRKRNFKEEYILFLKEYGIEYDEQYLWRD
ncbi:MAG: transposase [Tannerellaceae bacterium]|nr:transposase [Tannerellaceae bacterium]